MGTAAVQEQIAGDEQRTAQAPGSAPSTAASERVIASGPAQLLALQRTAGNRAVQRLLAAEQRRLDRCGCGSGRGAPCGCSAEPEPADEDARRAGAAGAAGAAAIRRAVAMRRAVSERHSGSPAVADRPERKRRLLHRMPVYAPNPTWSQAGSANPPPTCTPFFGAFGRSPEAEAKWQLYAAVLPDQIMGRCHCGLVRDAYRDYLGAAGGTRTLHDDGNCISEQLAAEDGAHSSFESAQLTAWATVENDFIRRGLPAGTTDVDLDLIEAANGNLVPVGPPAPRQLQVDGITYTRNTLAGGLLFGGGHDPGDPPDSECGNDSRVMTASVHLHRTDDGSDPTRIAVSETFTFRYALHDGFDFCPGNTVQMKLHPLSESADVTQQRIEYNQLLTDLSRLEASGMARDLCFDVQYHRTLAAVAHTVGIPPTGPQLAPTGVVMADILHIRGGPGTAFPTVGRAANGSSLTFDCFSHGESVRGDDAWCRIAGGNTWVSHSFIADTGSGRLPQCP